MGYVIANGLKIPVDENGLVPESALIKRFDEMCRKKELRDAEERLAAALNGETPKPFVNYRLKDYSTRAQNVIPLKCTPHQVAKWWRDPTACDVEDIDVRGVPKLNVPQDMTRSQRQAQGRIKVIGTPNEEKAVRRTLTSAYEDQELRTFADGRPTIIVQPMRRGYSGMYHPNEHEILIDRRRGINRNVIGHEGSHHLRNTDPSRTHVLTKMNPNPAIEESCTVAEEMARTDNIKEVSGYYASVAVYDSKKKAWRRPTYTEARRMAHEDHLLFTYGRGKGLKGEDAIKSVEKNWERSHIARLWYGSNKMAINILADRDPSIKKVSMAKDTATEKEIIEGIMVSGPKTPVHASRSSKQTKLFSRGK